MSRKKPLVMGLKHHYILLPSKDKVKKEYVFLFIPCDFPKKQGFEIID
jgi:hypothetical protein